MVSALFLHVNLFPILLSNLQNDNIRKEVNSFSQIKFTPHPYCNRTPAPPGLIAVYDRRRESILLQVSLKVAVLKTSLEVQNLPNSKCLKLHRLLRPHKSQILRYTGRILKAYGKGVTIRALLACPLAQLACESSENQGLSSGALAFLRVFLGVGETLC